MRFSLLPLIVFTSACLTFAQPPEGLNPDGQFVPPLDSLSMKLDTNGDRELSAEELSKASELLQTLDLNQDGKLNVEELFPRFRGGRPSFDRPGGMGPNRVEQELTETHDADKNGYLDSAERQEALKEVQAGGGGGRHPGERRGGPPTRSGTPGPKVSLNDVENHPEAGLYDSTVLRTVFIEFDTKTWEDEMARFKDTDVEIPASITVDGKEYPMVGVKFRGQSSFGHVPAGSKRSLNLSMDFIDDDQRLYGYKTINLLNCNGDASFLSSILFSHLASGYLPAPKANMMKVVINGESWGVYSNVQQYNKDFLKDFFGTTAGARWKVAGSPQADGGLRYLGDDMAPYRQRFEIKSRDDDDSWNALIDLCRVLNETPTKDLPSAIEPILDVDEVLRFLALDVAVANSDGYWTRASDYSIYLNPKGIFHIIPHDMNEAFRGGGHPGGGGHPRRRFPDGPPPQFGKKRDGPEGRPGNEIRRGPPDGGPGQADGFGGGRGQGFRHPHPVVEAIDRDKNGALSADELKNAAKALAALDKNRNGEIDQEELRPPFERGPGGRPDFRRPGHGAEGHPGGGPFGGRPEFGRPGERGGFDHPGDAGHHGGPTLDPLVGLDSERMPLRSKLLAVPQYRTRYLQYLRTIAERILTHKNLSPVIADYRELLAAEVKIDSRKLSSYDAFAHATAPLQKNAAPALGSLNDFIEQRRDFLLKHQEIKEVAAVDDLERPPIPRPHVTLGNASANVAVSEFLASNKRTNKDPQGEFEDWIELVNYGNTDIDLSGMFLTDDTDNLFKWKIPTGTSIKAGGYLIIWADKDDSDEGLHANFKLSKGGEAIILINNNAIVDKVEFGPQVSDVSSGRISGHAGKIEKLQPTPGAANRVID